MTQRTSDTLEDAEESLRKLNRDITIYRDPAVRRHLQTLSSPSTSTHLSEDPAQLKATIIAMRTELHDANEAHDMVKKDMLSERKRAAKAEAEIEELSKQMRERNIEHEEIIKGASDRIQKMERESSRAAQSAADKALLLQETVERDRLGHAGILAERDRFQTQAKELVEKVAALRRDLRAAEEGRRVDKRSTERDSESARAKIAALEAELEFMKSCLRGEKENSEKLRSSRRLSGDLQRRTATLKSELAEQTKQVASLSQKLMEYEENVSELREKLRTTGRNQERVAFLSGKVDSLRKVVSEAETIREQASALIREKEELTKLIARLSSTGDVQEGLDILRNSALTGTAIPVQGPGHTSGSASNGEELKVLEDRFRLQDQRQQKVIEELKVEKLDIEGRLAQAIEARDEATASNKRKDRLRRILEHEKTFFKAALERIETEFEDPLVNEAVINRWKERCSTFEKSSANYEGTVKHMERALAESAEKISILTADINTLKAQNIVPPADSSEKSRLQANLSEARKTAHDAEKARRDAVAKAREAQERLVSVERELQSLKVAAELASSKMTEVELDYDASKTKVLHLKDNLFSQAVKAAAAEEQKAKGKKRMRTGTDAISPRRDIPSDTQMAELMKQMEELEKLNGKLQQDATVGKRKGELAKKKIEEVRSVVYNLFGWSMKMKGAKYIISSIYAEDRDEIFEFGINEEGAMSMLETGYTQRLTEEIEQYVNKMKSIPALLSSVTMENFEKTTIA